MRWAAAGALLAALVVYKLLAGSNSEQQGLDEECDFEQIGEGIYRLQVLHAFARSLFDWQVEVNAFLVKTGQDAVLVDAGVSEHQYPELLTGALKRALEPAKLQLRLVVVTHGHRDHVGSLAAVFGSWPQAQVAWHAAEHDFIMGMEDFDPNKAAKNQSNSWLASQMWLYSSTVPSEATPERVLHLQGSEGDVSQLSSPSGDAVRWRPPEGLLRFYLLPGHSPGQVAYLHSPSRMLLSGDLIYNVREKSGLPELSRLPKGISFPNPQALQSIRQAASLEFDRIWPAHDAGQGVPKAAYAAWAAGLEDDP